MGAELRSTLSFLSVFDVTVFCRSVNGRINTLRKQNDTLRYTSSVVAKEDQVRVAYENRLLVFWR